MENSELLNALYSDELVYSDCCWLTGHNAYTYDWKVYSQQHLNISESFNYGVRSFMLDLHDYQNTVALCHDSCTTTYYLQKPGAPLEAEVLFKEIYNLLEVNKLDIITLHLESYVPRLSIDKVIQASDLDLLLLKSKNPNDPTLTLEYMRKHNERLVVFSDYGAGHGGKRNFTNFNDPTNLPINANGIYYTTNYKETQCNMLHYYKCEANEDFRAKYNDVNIKLFTFNHFYSITPMGKPYATTNSFENIKLRVDICNSLGLHPNFIAVDFVELGNNGGAKRIVKELMEKKKQNIHDEL